MRVEIINTSGKDLPPELEDALRDYAPYHEFAEQRNRFWFEIGVYSYAVSAAFVKVDEEHTVIWISYWHKHVRL